MSRVFLLFSLFLIAGMLFIYNKQKAAMNESVIEKELEQPPAPSVPAVEATEIPEVQKNPEPEKPKKVLKKKAKSSLNRSQKRTEQNKKRYKEIKKQALSELPDSKELARPNNHRPHPKLFDAADPITEIEDKMKNDPDFVDSGIEFFSQCASSEEKPSAVRALCVKKLRQWSQKTGRKKELARVNFGSRIESIVKELP